MKKIFYIFFFFTLLITACEIKNPNSDLNQIEDQNRFQCSVDSDCANCCSNKCTNYEWWKKNGPKIECKCKTNICACVDNECIIKK